MQGLKVLNLTPLAALNQPSAGDFHGPLAKQGSGRGGRVQSNSIQFIPPRFSFILISAFPPLQSQALLIFSHLSFFFPRDAMWTHGPALITCV